MTVNANGHSPLISLRNVGVTYKRRSGFFRPPKLYNVFNDLSFDVFPGETIGIVGRNGAGKSTLLKIMAGLIIPDQGQILNRGASVSLLSLQAGFDAELSGRDNAVFSGMVLGYTKKQVMARLKDICDFSELGDFFYEPVKTYSAGMRSRLGFSVAMYMSPDVLLLDEILSVGDKQFRAKAEKAMMRKINSEQTVVLVSHSEAQINAVCDRKIEL